MNEEKRSNKRQTVFSVGNSWIICPSKSHPGNIYYFNTATGEALWNLSEAEIEKSGIIKQPNDLSLGSKAGPFREPKGNPPIEQNQINNQQLQCLPPQQQSTSSVLHSNLFPVKDYDLNTFLLNTPIIASNNWPIQRTQQIIITPTIPLVNQAQPNASLNVGYSQSVTTNRPCTSRFREFQNTPIWRQRLFQHRKKFERGGQRNFKKCLDTNDLRQQLYLKRRLNKIANQKNTSFIEEQQSTTNKSEYEISAGNTAEVSSHIADLIEEEHVPLHKNHGIMEKNTTETTVEEIPPLLDLTPLKSLAPSNTHSHSWYLVVDLRVLLDEYDFLKMMINSDEHCHLMIPGNVMAELKDYIARSNNIPARRIFLSLTKEIENGSTFVAGEFTQDYGDTITNLTLKTCLQLFEENFHVILLTKDKELLSCKKFIKINIFSVDEVKSLLQSNSHAYPPTVATVSHNINTPPTNNTLLKAMPPRSKTTINNHTVQDTKLTEADAVIKPFEANTVATFRNKVDAAIQTDKVAVIDSKNNTYVVDAKNKKSSNDSSNVKSNKEPLCIQPVMQVLPTKRKDIKLKRNIYNKTSKSNIATVTNKTKSFRWRRNKKTNLSGLNNERPSSPIIQNVPKAMHEETITRRQDTVTHSVQTSSYEQESLQNIGDNVESRESSIISIDTRKHSITIAETSTSGIISNSESNVDISLEESYTQDTTGQTNDVENLYSVPKDIESKNDINDIDSENMEESLKMKCKEYVLRFVAIMEEVLAAVLQKESMFSNIEFAPPWTLHEAAQCVGKYCNNSRVTCATDKLSCIIFNLSDSTGKIYTNVTPSQFMEMYSNGLRLLEEMKVITTCEDIEVAERSLQRLLRDIKNPSYDCNDSIIDPNKDATNNPAMSSTDSSTPDGQSPRRSYNLRSTRRRVVAEPDIIERKLDIKTRFFSNLRLMKIISPTNRTNTYNETPGDETSSLAPVGGENENTVASDNDSDESPSDHRSTTNFVRNFSKCAQLEEKLKNKINTNTCEVDEEYLDYEENYEYTTADCPVENIIVSEKEAALSDQNVSQIDDTAGPPDSVAPRRPETVDPLMADRNEYNETFQVMICVFLGEVTKAMTEVKSVCDKCFVELKRPYLSLKERTELKRQIDNAHLHIVDLCVSLERMQLPDPNAPTDNVRTALKLVGINITQIDRSLVLQYWNTVAKCKKDAEVFLYTTRNLIKEFESR